MDKDLILSEEKGERKLMVHGEGSHTVHGSGQLWFMVNGSNLTLTEN